MSLPNHLIERGWEQYEFHTSGNGVEPDKLQFLSGVATAIGILAGSLDVGIPEGTHTIEVMAKMIEELSQYRSEIANLENEARRRTERRNH